MAFNQAYNAYRKASVTTASQGELIVLLYEGAVKRLTQASARFDEKGKIPVAEIEAFSADVLKAQEIITELQVSLDMEKGGEIATNLMALYMYFNEQLMAANISKSREQIEFVLHNMKELTESWRQAVNTTANQPAMQVQQALNIEG